MTIFGSFMLSLDILFGFFAIEFFVVMLNAIADWKVVPIGVRNKVGKAGQVGFGILGVFLLVLAVFSTWAAFDAFTLPKSTVLATFKGEEGTEVTTPIEMSRILWFKTQVEPGPIAELTKDWEGLQEEEQRDRLVEQMPYFPDDTVIRYKPPLSEDFKLAEWKSLTENERGYIAEYIKENEITFGLPYRPDL